MPHDLPSRNGDEPVPPTARYVVITPARNEAENIGETIASIKRQKILPSAWYIVDDGSSDATVSIVQAATHDAPWIHLICREDRGYRIAGADVQSFFVGYEQIADTEWEYVVKLDADLRFADDYFSSCLNAFEQDAKLGIVGGTIYNVYDDERIPERHPAFHVRGATKIYRRACWEDIGGLAITPAWDTIDEVSANMHGWTTRTLPDVPIDHLRPTGAGFGQWNYWVKNGRAAYLVGYHPLFLLARAVLRVARRPYVIGAVGLIWGYFRSVVRREPRDVEDDLARYVRGQQWNRLTGRESVWK